MGYYAGGYYYPEPGDPGFDPRNNPVDNTPIQGGANRVEPPTPEPIKGVVIGTSPKTNEVLVKTDDNRRIWVKTDKETIDRATDVINENERIAEQNKGIEQANKWIDQKNREQKQMEAMAAMSHNAKVSGELASQDKALKKLSEYEVEAGQYDIGKALRMDPGTEKVLRDAGFKQEDIDKAKESNNARMPASQFTAQYFDDRGWTLDRKQKDGESNKAYEARIKQMDKRMIEASDAYIAKYGGGDFALSGAANMASFVVPVAKVIAPGVSWKDVNAGDIAISAVQVALIATPFVAAKVVTGAKTVMSGSQAIKVTQAVKAGTEETKSFLRSINSKLERPFNNLSKAQEKYVKANLEVRDLQATLKRVAPGAETRPGIEESLVRAEKALEVKRAELMKAGETYAKAMKNSKMNRYDSPTVKESIDRLPRDLVRHTDDVVADMLKPKSPIGNIAKMQGELANARTAIPKLQSEIKGLIGKEGTAARVKTLTTELQKARKIAKTYPEKIDTAIKRMDVEFGRGGKYIKDSGRGGVTTLDRPPVRGSRLDTELARAGVGRKSVMVGPGGANRTESALRATTTAAAAREALSRGEEPEPVDAVSTKRLTAPKTGTGASSQPFNKPSEFTSLGKSTGPASGPVSSTKPVSDTSINTTPKGETKPATKPQPRVATNTGTRTMTGTRYPRSTKPLPKFLPSMEQKSNGALHVKKGSLVWEQGKLEVDKSNPGPETVYKVAQPPKYKVETVIANPPKGYRDTGDTPRETIQTIGGPVKRTVRVNLGITTAIAKPDQKRIEFVRNKDVRRPKFKLPKAPKPTKSGAYRFVRPHLTRRGGGITRRSNR